LESASSNTPAEKKPKLSEEAHSDANVVSKQATNNAPQQKTINKTTINATKPPKATKNVNSISNSSVAQASSTNKSTKQLKSTQSSKSIYLIRKETI
jgi:hypothetical protein